MIDLAPYIATNNVESVRDIPIKCLSCSPVPHEDRSLFSSIDLEKVVAVDFRSIKSEITIQEERKRTEKERLRQLAVKQKQLEIERQKQRELDRLENERKQERERLEKQREQKKLDQIRNL